jgi:uncharacterized protein
MTSDARFVLDTGVLVSAVLLPRSVPRQAVDLAFAQGIVLASADTIDELDQVLQNEQNARDLEIINRRTDFLNQEASEVLEYQVPL